MTSNEPLGQVLTFDTLSTGVFDLVFNGKKKNQNPDRNNFLGKLLNHHAIMVIF